ncbi:MAG: chaperone NapD [Deltaproteobacteria bacterium]|jgi:nitrate reductase NapAB chaperone NapD|nr:chaperone NapD [Deltaproteobacteria bacterium]MBW2476574.1 chaperone NapD [Deltaproteobacteria bacterium]MBW2503066.1 chaperone NapD [Deltaproteobacteria bacterium]MBW2521050.1 chaperone NapD [Deltaproteobacteria bacterium]
MPISGLVIQVDPDQREATINSLNNLEHVELTPTPKGEALVAVLDVATMQQEESLFRQINDLPGVHNVTLSYHNFEDVSEEQSN